jgi:flagellar FliJ protein
VKKFSFDLENILELRAYREHEAEIVLGRAVGELTRIEQNIAAIAREKIRVSTERFTLGYAVSELLAFERYVQRLDNTKEILFEKAAEAELKVEAARIEYLAMSKEREVLDKVKEGEAKEYRKHIFAEEDKISGDISGGIYTRKMETV